MNFLIMRRLLTTALALCAYFIGVSASSPEEASPLSDNPYNTYDEVEPHIAAELERIAAFPSDVPLLVTSPGYKPCRVIMECQFVEYWLMDNEKLLFALNLLDFYPAAESVDAMEEINTQEILIVYKNIVYQIEEVRILPEFIIHLIASPLIVDI